MSQNINVNGKTPVGMYHLSYYLPNKVIGIDEVAKIIGLNDEESRNYRVVRGLMSIHVTEETPGDMAVKVGLKALNESRFDPREIDAVIFFHSLYNMTLAPASLVGRIQCELGLTRSLGFSISGQGCSTINTAIRAG